MKQNKNTLTKSATIPKYTWWPPSSHLLKNGKVLCPKCLKEEANLSEKYGVMYGENCINEDRNQAIKANKYPEFVPERIKTQRSEFASSLLQPYRGGQLSKEYVDKYGTKRLNVTDKEVRNAKNVWTGDVLKSGWERSK